MNSRHQQGRGSDLRHLPLPLTAAGVCALLPRSLRWEIARRSLGDRSARSRWPPSARRFACLTLALFFTLPQLTRTRLAVPDSALAR